MEETVEIPFPLMLAFPHPAEPICSQAGYSDEDGPVQAFHTHISECAFGRTSIHLCEVEKSTLKLAEMLVRMHQCRLDDR